MLHDRIRAASAWKKHLITALLGLMVIINLHCSDSTEPEPPAKIEIVSGNEQYSLRGTILPEPLVVRVTTASGSVSEGVEVRYEFLEGSGTLSRTQTTTDASGFASVILTLGQETGTIIVRVYLAVDPAKTEIFQATSANFYCPEADPNPGAPSYGTSGRIMLATQKSSIYSSTSETKAGIVVINPLPPGDVVGFTEIPETGFVPTIGDIAFSPYGELYFATSRNINEILKVFISGEVTHFATLDFDILDAELTLNSNGLLVGCDSKGPFVVGCRDTVLRFEEASYDTDHINNDAVYADPSTDDIYFIDMITPALIVLPLDSLTVEGPVEPVVVLTATEAQGARGMVATTNGTIYILVDWETTHRFLRIDPAAKTIDRIEIDLSPIGVYRDLAIARGSNIMFTIDTLNDALVAFDGGQFAVLFTSEELSIASPFSGERVGLAIIP